MADKKIRKMEKLVSATSCLHAALEGLTEMEIYERKVKQLQRRQMEMMKANFDLFNEKIENQRKEVRYFRSISLWSKTFDKSVDLMARIVFMLHARIRSVFGNPWMMKLSAIETVKEKLVPHSGPLLNASKPAIVRFYSRKSNLFFDDDDEKSEQTNNQKINKSSVFHCAGPSTVGGSGLAMRYANVILLAEKYFDSSITLTHDERESLYEMLPENLKVTVRTKLSKNMRWSEDLDNDASLAEGWKEAMVEMMRWLVPVANDTVNWQMERSFEKMKFDAKPSVLLMQTLHFADKEKTEAAIAEILVGLSCIFRFENRRLGV